MAPAIAPTALVLEREVAPSNLDFGSGADLDVQITTAKKYPRSITAFLKKARDMALLDADTATACFYSLPRDGKRITGPSARLAEICATAYGNLAIAAKISGEDDRFVHSVGAAWDMENNVKIAFEARRRITNRKHERYNDDMIGTTGNAASSIALRNAVFKVIPSAFWRPIFEECRKVAVGDAKTLAGRRQKMLEYFQATMAVDAARVFTALGVKGVEDITLEHLETLIGISNAIREGDTTPEEAFPNTVPQPSRASEANGTSPGGGAAAGGAPSSPSVAPVETTAAAVAPPSSTRDVKPTGEYALTATAERGLRDDLDQVLRMWKQLRKHGAGFWFPVNTKRLGTTTAYTMNVTHGELLAHACERTELVKLMLGKPDPNGLVPILDVAIIDGTTGEQKA